MKRAPAHRGSITIWLLGLGMGLLVVGGLGMDLWAALVVHSRLSGMAEAIATASASGISEDHWRRTGQIRLEPERAKRLGRRLAATHPEAGLLDSPPQIVVDSDRQRVSVRVRGTSRLILLRLVSGSDRLEVAVTATSRPVVVG